MGRIGLKWTVHRATQNNQSHKPSTNTFPRYSFLPHWEGWKDPQTGFPYPKFEPQGRVLGISERKIKAHFTATEVTSPDHDRISGDLQMIERTSLVNVVEKSNLGRL